MQRRSTRRSLNSLLLCLVGAALGVSCTTPSLNPVVLSDPPRHLRLAAPPDRIGGSAELLITGNHELPGDPRQIFFKNNFVFPVGKALERAFGEALSPLFDEMVTARPASVQFRASVTAFRLQHRGARRKATCDISVVVNVFDRRGVRLDRYRLKSTKSSSFDGASTPQAVWAAAYEMSDKLRKSVIASRKIAEAATSYGHDGVVERGASGRPVVTLSSPSGLRTNAETIPVVLSVRSQNPIETLRLSVNGALLGLPLLSGETLPSEISLSHSIRLEPGKNLIHLAATDVAGKTRSASVVVTRTSGFRSSAQPAAGGKYRREYGRRIAAVVGINKYRRWPDLEGARGDARRVAGALRKMGFDEVVEVYDEDATRARLLRLLGTELAQKAKREDLTVIFFAGHGQTETLPNGQKRGYLVPADADPLDSFATAISMDALRELSNRLPSKHVYYAMDSCYSGLGFVRGLPSIAAGGDYIGAMTSRRAVQMITAGAEGEESLEIAGQGLFTAKLLDAMSGEADFNRDGYVTASEIGTYVRPAVSAASGVRQTPQFGTLEGSGEVVFKLR